MRVSDGMSKLVLTVGPDHTLRDAAASMAERGVGAAIVLDPEGQAPGILTERDVLRAVAAGEDLATEKVGTHMSADVVYADPGWSLEEAAVAMVRGSFRHLIVMRDGNVCGVLSVRDVVRCWTDDGSICDVPESAREALAARSS
jgi:CBS domain-containing protein